MAYVTNADLLLVFRHVAFPDAGIQVPAGTIEEGESPEDTVLREVEEETGLDHLEIRSFLGTRNVDMVPWGNREFHRRHFYHIECLGETADRWRHFETTRASGGGPFEFELFWVRLPDDVPELIGGQGDMLDRLPPPSA